MPRQRPDDRMLAAIPTCRPGVSKRDLQRDLGMTRQTVWRVIKRLHGAKLIHIGGWLAHPTGGPFLPRYVAGPGPDVECTLAPMSNEETQRRYRDKARASGAWDVRAAKIRAKYLRDKVRKTLWYAALRPAAPRPMR